MKTVLAITMMLGAASFTTAYAEWEILEPGTAVSVEAKATGTATGTSAAPIGQSELSRSATE